MQGSGLTKQQQSLPDSPQRTMLISRYGNREAFLAKYNPDYQRQICATPDLCFFGDFPTFGMLREAYGNNAPVMWLIPQLYNLSEYCGCRDKLQGKPLEECASVIASEFFYLKISETMLFFHWFKSGRYGRFYGSVDPLVITTSIRDFPKERDYAYERHERDERYTQKEEELKHAVSWQQYCKMEEEKLRAQGKNEEADRWIDKPNPLTALTSSTEQKETPKENVENVVRIAQSLLNDPKADESIKASFCKLFKKKYGCTPQEYIEKNANK